jgi:hypothetical protein
VDTELETHVAVVVGVEKGKKADIAASIVAVGETTAPHSDSDF